MHTKQEETIQKIERGNAPDMLKHKLFKDIVELLGVYLGRLGFYVRSESRARRLRGDNLFHI